MSAVLARSLLARYAASEDLVRIGAYQRGSDPQLDRALEVLPAVNAFLRQDTRDLCTFAEAEQLLLSLPC